MCTTIQDKCPACQVTYLNNPQFCTSPTLPSFITVIQAPVNFAGLEGLFTNVLITRWCDECILRVREYDEVMDVKKSKEKDLDDLLGIVVRKWCEVDGRLLQVVSDFVGGTERMTNEEVYDHLKEMSMPSKVSAHPEIEKLENFIRKKRAVSW